MQLPYVARPGQLALVAAIEDVQRRARHGVFESPTGTGKTIAALAASAQVAKDKRERVIYATRTNSQQSQVVKEHGALEQAGQDPGLLIPFMGRKHYCPMLANDERFAGGTAEELGRLCRDAKQKATKSLENGEPIKGACPYYAKLLEDGTGPVEALLTAATDPQKLGEQVAGCGSCPYEALKQLMPRATTVLVPHIFLIDD